jgi:hypothetical protein
MQAASFLGRASEEDAARLNNHSFFFRSLAASVMVNSSGGEQRAILSHFFCNKAGNRARGVIHTYIGFRDTVGDWLIGLEIVQLFFFGIEDSLPPFFRFGETVGSLYDHQSCTRLFCHQTE